MFKLLALICTFLALSSVYTQDCSGTSALRSLYGFGNTLSTAQSYSDIKYCKSIKGGPVCCTDTDMNSIADKSAAMIANLTSNVGARDIYLKNALDVTIPAVMINLNTLMTVAEQFDSYMNISLSDLSDLGISDSSDINFSDFNLSDFSDINFSDFSDLDLSDFDLSDFSDINLSDFSDINFSDVSDINLSDFNLSDLDLSDLDLSDFTDFNDISDSSDDGLGGFLEIVASLEVAANLLSAGTSSVQSSYISYQQARVTCVEAMVNFQNAAYCLACDPSAATKGYTAPSTISISTNVCSRLQNACSAYISSATDENQLLTLSYSNNIIQTLTTFLQDTMTNNATGSMDVYTSLENMANSTTTYSSPMVQPALTPFGCDKNGNCDWICDGLFNNGKLDQEALAVGGTFDAFDAVDSPLDAYTRRLLQSAAKSNAGENRMLDDGQYNPDSDEAGVTVVFPQDPANTDSSSTSTTSGSTSSKKFSSLNLGNIFVGMMVVISSILLF